MIHFVLCGHFFYVSKLAGAFRYSRNLSENVNNEKLTDVTETTVRVTDESGPPLDPETTLVLSA